MASALALLILAGCTAVQPTPPAPVVILPAAPAAPTEAPAPAAPALPPPAATPATLLPAPAPPPVAGAPATRQVMLVESVPTGAIIVVDGRPVGKTPVRLDVPTTPLGFFRNDLEVRARFVARDETEVSRTATEEFNPRERVPTVLRFTPDGVQRTVVNRATADPTSTAAP